MPPQADVGILADLAVIMMVAGAVTLVFQRLRQPVIFGYILAGLIVGPFTPPFSLVSRVEVIHSLADLGIILLLFSLGLEFSFMRLRQIGQGVLLAAVLEVLFVFVSVYEVARVAGLDLTNALFLAAALSISSTAVILKVITDQNKTHEAFARVVFGLLIIEDLIATALLALLSGLGATGRVDLAAVGGVLLNIVLFGAASLVMGAAIVPRLVNYAANFKSREILLMVVLGLCFGMALLSQKLGLSVAVGAFIMGSLMSGSGHTRAIEDMLRPVTSMFAGLFFVSVGMLINPALVVQYWPLALLFTVVFVASKLVAGSIAVFLGGFGMRTAFQTAMGMATVGEFSFVMAAVGGQVPAVGPHLYPVVAAVSVLTTLLLPHLVRASASLSESLEKATPGPLRTFVLSADAVLERVRRASRGPDPLAVATRRSLGGIGINLLLLGLVGVLARVLLEMRVPLADFLGLEYQAVLPVIIAAAAVLALQPGFAILRHVRSFLRAAVELLMRHRDADWLQGRRFLYRFLLDAVVVFLALAVGALFLPIISYSTDFTQYAPFALLGLVTGISVYMAVDAFRLVHQRLERLFRQALGGQEEDEVEKKEAAETKTAED